MFKISVVIPTLGGSSLKDTIESLNSGVARPEEILVCIPRGHILDETILDISNIEVIHCDERGQVAQRSVGFDHAQCDYVLQLDDDIQVDRYCLEYLLMEMDRRTHPIAISPSMLYKGTTNSVYESSELNILRRVYYWLLNGRMGLRPGSITLAGTSFGIDVRAMENPMSQVAWLPGGCVLHKRLNLVRENYFPFEGKAYCEDLIHSSKLTQNGINLYVSRNAVCFLDEEPERHGKGIFSTISSTVSDYQARKYYVKLSRRSVFRLRLYFVVSLVRLVLSKLAGRDL